MGISLGLKYIVVAAAALSFASAMGSETAKFKLRQIIDRQGTGQPGIYYLVPDGWKPNDTISWDLSRRTAPMEYTLSAASPDGRFSFTYLNEVPFWYTKTSNIGNKGTEPPTPLTDFLVNLFKKNHPGVSVEVVDRQETPVTNGMFKSTPVMNARSAKCSLKLRYTLNGVPTIMKAVFDFDGYDSGTAWGRAHGFSNGEWYLTNLAQIIGPEAEFTKAMKLAAVAFSSTRFDPAFVQEYQKISGQIVNDMINAGQARLDANFQSQQQALQAKWSANAKFTRDMCDYVLDQERYTDGKTQFIMPIGYNRAITNGDEIILTDDRSYNPGPDWTDLKKIN